MSAYPDSSFKHDIYTRLKGVIPPFSDRKGNSSSDTVEPARPCLFAAIISAFGSILVLILSSNFFSHTSVTWLAICIFTWMISIASWLLITLLVMNGIGAAKMHASFAMCYFLAVAISMSIISAKLKIIGAESFDDGLFPLRELNWSFLICMLSGALCSYGYESAAKRSADRADTESQQSRCYGGC